MLSSAVAFGAIPTLARVAYDHGATPFTLLTARFGLAWAALWAIQPGRRSGQRAGLPFVLGAVGYAGTALSFFAALRYVPAGVASLLMYTYPVLVTLATALRRRRAPTAGELAGVAAAVGGCALVLEAGLERVDGRGVLLALVSAVAYASFIVASDRAAAHLPAAQTARGVIAGAFATSLAAALVSGDRFDAADPVAWAAAAGLGLLSTAYAITAFLAGIARLGPAAASVVSAAEPLTAVILAAAAVGEPLTPPQAAGAGLVVGAVILAARSKEGEASPASASRLPRRHAQSRRSQAPAHPSTMGPHQSGRV